MKSRSAFVRILSDETGQSWVETVVMLPVLMLVFIGLFYFFDLTRMQAQAIEAARYVTWETTWYVREESDEDRTVATNQALQADLQAMGLGAGLNAVVVTPGPLSTYLDRRTGREDATFFVPDALASLFAGSGVEDGQAADFVNGLGSAANTIFEVGAAVAIPIHEILGYTTNWHRETDQSVYTTEVRYDFGYGGLFRFTGPTRIREFSSVLSHPLNIRRVNREDDGDESEYTALVGDPDPVLCDNGDVNFGPGNGQTAHIFGLWVAPSIEVPDYSTPVPGLGAVTAVTSEVVDLVKTIACGAGGLFGTFGQVVSLGGLLGESELGFKMPDGTLKEYPEIDLPADAGGSSGGGSGLGTCEGGGPLASAGGDCG